MTGAQDMGNAPATTGAAPRHIAASDLADFVTRLFRAAGVAADAARAVAFGLVDADLEGLHSHGVMLVDMYIERICQGSVSRNERATIVSDRHGAVVLDAGNALGQLTGRQAMAIAVDKAKEFGAGVVAVRHGFHFGTAGKYAEQAAAADCIGIAMCNTRPLMPAPGGAERIVGNNPIAVALPTDDEIPLILDMATSEAAMGKIRIAERAKEPIPATWAVTAQGEPTTNPAEAIAGMLLPSGGAKGFGFALMIDLMCGLLSGGASGADVRRSMAILPRLTIVHISSSPSTSPISALQTTFGDARQRPLSCSVPPGAPRACLNCLRPASRNGGGGNRPTVW